MTDHKPNSGHTPPSQMDEVLWCRGDPPSEQFLVHSANWLIVRGNSGLQKVITRLVKRAYDEGYNAGMRNGPYSKV